MENEEDREIKGKEDEKAGGAPGFEAAPGEDKYVPSEERQGPAAPPAASNVPPAKANTLNRSIARFIDILVALLLARLPGYVGVLSGLTYIAIADGLMGGRSLGKKVIGLRAVYRKDGRLADFRASILRNSTMGVLYLVFLVPIAGWVLAGLGLAFELLLIIGSPEGMRLGDEIASTVVIDDVRE
jgi:uncharacterized RDD family membrane protein YckC